jgi:lambda repressor-like predicted transcriptional regulator
MEERKLIAQAVDVETGEILTDIYENDRIVPFKEKSEDDLVYNFNEETKFVKLYLGVNELRKYLTQGEFTVAVSLADFVSYDDCIIRHGGHQNGKILSIKDLADEMEINYDALRKTITSLVKKGVLGIHKTGCKDKPNTI